MERRESIPTEYTKERPHVFENENNWGLVRDFALRYNELKNQTETKDITSLLDLVGRIEEEVKTRVKEVLSDVLKERRIPETDEEALLAATGDRDFSGIDFTHKEKLVTALGLAMVSERARTQTMMEALGALDEQGLSIVGMTPEQRDVAVELLRVARAANPEYIRFKARSLAGEKFPEYPVDAIREEHRIAEGIQKVRELIAEKGSEHVFGEAGPAFVEFLELYEKGYRSIDENNRQLIKKGTRERRYTEFRKAFEKFMKEHPDFPLILFPRGDKYVSETSGLALGRDPEIRISWQSPDMKEETQELVGVRDDLARYLTERFGPLLEEGDGKRIKTNRPLVAGDLGYFGIGIQMRAEAQELEGTSILFKNAMIENRVSTRKTMRELFGENVSEIVDSPAYLETADTAMMVHEWGHQVHSPEKTRGAKNLGKSENKINEMKSDLIAHAAFYPVFERRARELYGNRAREALNMYTISYALDLARTIAPNSEERPYYISALAVLNRLERAGIIKKEGEKAVLDLERIKNEDLSASVFESQLEELLTIYHEAETGPEGNRKEIRERARTLGEVEPDPAVQTLIMERHE